MRIEDCVLTGDFVVGAPFTRTEPEEEWVLARDSGAIPIELFELYRRAHYLSFGSAPKFLADPDNVLFSYFSMLLRSVMESFVDSQEQLQSFIAEQKLTYDAGKKLRGEAWDPSADIRARRHFRNFLIALQSSLDVLADLIALFFTGLIPRLHFGRAQFSRVEDWLRRPLPPFGLVLTPYDERLRKLFNSIAPLVHATGQEREWLPLMRMLRNKAAHLGHPVFRQVGLHDQTPKFYTFIPRQWPYIWERHMRPRGSASPYGPDFLKKFFLETLMHQDVVSYGSGLRAKVMAVVQAGVSQLAETYHQFQDFPLNSTALAELQGNSENYSFERFPNA
jgi:hypothetical protein